jgi:hypothetical protein
MSRAPCAKFGVGVVGAKKEHVALSPKGHAGLDVKAAQEVRRCQPLAAGALQLGQFQHALAAGHGNACAICRNRARVPSPQLRAHLI